MSREYITFDVAGQVFGFDIMAIREIRAWTQTTRLPRVPDYIAGVVNLRGTVVPVVDLAARIGWEKTVATPRHAIIVTRLGKQARGYIVDAVRDIVTTPPEGLQPPPATRQEVVAPFLEGLLALEDRMVMALNLVALNGDCSLAEAA